VRLGDIRAAEFVERLGVDSVVGRMALDYARAFTAADASGLDASAAAFGEIGMRGVSKDAAAQAESARRG
jgi:hypothetical protein